MNDNDADKIFSVGMHQFGFPDIEIPLSLFEVDDAVEMMQEFRDFLIANNLYDIEDKVEYESPYTGAVYSLERGKEERFDIDGEARFNKFGM